MKLIYVFWNQLNHQSKAIKSYQDGDVVILAETWRDATYVSHHKKKLAYLFSAQRHFAEQLKSNGIIVDYHKITQTKIYSHADFLTKKINKYKPDKVIITEPCDYYQQQDINNLFGNESCKIDILADDSFFLTKQEFFDWSNSQKSLLLENFYREMRNRTNYLMEDHKPCGGKWNYDKQNRHRYKGDPPAIPIKKHCHDEITKIVCKEVSELFPNNFGDIEPFSLAVTADQAKTSLMHFIDKNLRYFGEYQDAMATGQPFLFHSAISTYINSGLLSAKYACQQVINAYEQGKVPINSAEGFIRQVIGWREYMRGIYWLKMPEYKKLNFLDANKQLPPFFWTSNTNMNCLSQVIKQTKEHAYAHHIQRLMITGNFALLAGLKVDEVCEWYHIVYSDAYEWVELPNTLGMALYADGGGLSTKPYAASSNYINKMSDYCKNCKYDFKQRTGPNACPFNYLYWNFFIQHKKKLQDNHRLRMVYNNLRKIPLEECDEIQMSAQKFLEKLY